MRLSLSAAAVALLLSGCAGAGPVTPETALQAAGMTREAYCALAPQARAEVRRILGLRVALVACPGDRTWSAGRRRAIPPGS